MTLASLTLASMTLLGGCGGDESVRTYDVDKEPVRDPVAAPPTPDPMSVDMGPGDVPPPPPPEVGMTWTLPAGWSEVENRTPMRVATLMANDELEVSVTQLPGPAGGVGANINRWREQVGLPLATQDEMASEAIPIATPSAMGVVVDLIGPSDTPDQAPRILAAVFPAPNGATTWFLKAIAPRSAIDPYRDAFIELCQSVSLEGGAAASAPPTSQPAAPPSAASGASGPVRWGELPAGWTIDAQPAGMSVASMTVTTADGSASMTITPLGGNQELLANVNRWRGQVGLASAASLDDAGGRAITIDGLDGVIVEAAGPAQGVLGAVTTRGATTWFFKLAGPTSILTEHAAAFESFVTAARFEDGA